MPKVTEPNSKIQSSDYYWSNGDPGWCRLVRVKSSTTKETIELDSGQILRKRPQAVRCFNMIDAKVIMRVTKDQRRTTYFLVGSLPTMRGDQHSAGMA